MPLTRKVAPSVQNYNEGSSPLMAKITGHVRLPSTPNDESCQSSGHRTALKPRRLLIVIKAIAVLISTKLRSPRSRDLVKIWDNYVASHTFWRRIWMSRRINFVFVAYKLI
ncbi:hypothetical protein CDAR_204841 [Caerostris darwini]|uniref:Uncharacterized protein n=1 Tax=Caerostris darwini TaxID=1538125 RepID=A0AAV4PEX3_9ARAC|nr:hypothetical protein CDAR_204841 [Caerostris darwini]